MKQMVMTHTYKGTRSARRHACVCVYTRTDMREFNGFYTTTTFSVESQMSHSSTDSQTSMSQNDSLMVTFFLSLHLEA